MKSIIFVRHSKSSWKHNVADRERPLKTRGVTDAQAVSEKFKEFDIQPDIIYSSPANRAFSTCQIFMNVLEISDQKLQIIEELYDFEGYSVLNFIKSLDDSLQNVMIFGHNHAFTSLVNSLGTKYIDNLPTSGLAKIDFQINSWADLDSGVTSKLIFPRDVR